MDVERLTEEYLKRRATLEALTKTVTELKEMLIEVIDKDGVPDESGHLWYTAGNFLLERQKSQPKKYLDSVAAEQWARDKGIWNDVHIKKEVLSEDALLGWVFDHRGTEGLEDEFQKLYITPAPTWSFIKPKEQKQYEY